MEQVTDVIVSHVVTAVEGMIFDRFAETQREISQQNQQKHEQLIKNLQELKDLLHKLQQGVGTEDDDEFNYKRIIKLLQIL